MVVTVMGLAMSCCPIHGFFRIPRSSKMKIASQESCQLNQNKSSTLNRTGPQEFDNLSSYTLPRGVHYKSSTLPPPTHSRTPTTYSSTINKSRPSSIVTMSAGDDLCAINELLEGRMYLTVILPPELVNLKSSNNSGNKVVINVERRTPMMDILVNIATQYKFNASKYRIYVDGHNFKASTPIGSLDVNTVAIVSKPSKPGFRSNDNLPQVMPTSPAIYQIPTKQRSATPPSKSSENSNHLPHHQGLPFISNVPFKPTFRLQVNLPRNQLMVLRVSPESSIDQIKAKICEDKELDPTKYQLTAKDKELSLLDPIKCLADYGIHEVSLISNSLLTKARMEQPTNINGNIDHSYQNQDQMTVNQYQTTTQAVGKLNKPIKKRPAPLPPSKSRLNEESIAVEKADKTNYKQSIEAHCEENHKMDDNEKVISCSSHLRQDSGSDSSGYHESLASSESPRPSSESVNQQDTNLNCRNKLNGKEVSKKVITKKRKAPPPPNLKEDHGVDVDGGGSNCSTSSNKSEIGESIDCLSDVSVPLSSSSSGSSRRSDYRIVDGRDSSLHEDETSFTLVSGSDDLDDIGTLKGSDSAPIPSPDSGTCCHVPLDEEINETVDQNQETEKISSELVQDLCRHVPLDEEINETVDQNQETEKISSEFVHDLYRHVPIDEGINENVDQNQETEKISSELVQDLCRHVPVDEGINENVDQNQETKKISSEFVRDLCRPRVRLTNFKIGSYQQINNLDIYQSPNTSNGKENCISNDVPQDDSNSANESPKSSAIDTVKPVIVTASLKNGNTSACNEFGHNSSHSINSNTKISMIAPQPFKLNRLASWSGTDTKSFRQAYSNISNIVENRKTIAEKAEKIEKVLRIERPIDRIPRINNGFTGGHRCVSQIEINGDSAKVSIRNTLSTNENDESPIQVTTFVKSEQTPLINNNQIKESDLQKGPSKQKQQIKISPDTNTKLEIIKTVKPKTEPISSIFGGPSIKSMETRSLTPKVPVPILPSYIPQPPPPPPPPPPPMPNTTSGCKKIVRSVPKFKKTNSSTSKTDFHDALLNEIRACGGRGALRKVNIHR